MGGLSGKGRVCSESHQRVGRWGCAGLEAKGTFCGDVSFWVQLPVALKGNSLVSKSFCPWRANRAYSPEKR